MSWKKHFLASGVPLEYEVARIVAEQGMSARADLSFMRKDGTAEKEMSADIETLYFGPSDHELKYSLNIVIECKYRSKDKSFIFFPEPNIEFSRITLGGTISVFDNFVDYTLDSSKFTAFEDKFDFAYKGIELYEGGAHDQEIRRGINQLRYASPSMLMNALDNSLFSHDEERLSVFCARILVTNCDLRLVNEDITLEQIEKCENLDEISKATNSLILYSECGPDYKKHFRKSFSEDTDDRMDQARHVDLLLKNKKLRYPWGTAVELVQNLHLGRGYQVGSLDDQFFVSNLQALPTLLRDLKKVCLQTYRARKYDGTTSLPRVKK